VAVIAGGGLHWIARWLPESLALPLASFAGAAAAAALTLRLAETGGGESGLPDAGASGLLLSGAAVNAAAGGGVALLCALSDDIGLRGAMLWLFGNLGRAGWSELAVAGPAMTAMLALLPALGRSLDLLLLGDAEAASLGVALPRLRRTLIALTLLGVGSAVAVSGLIGFIGFVAPQLARLWLGPGHHRVLPASALLGASLLLLADTAARTLAAPLELPVGALTSLVGGPLLLVMLRRAAVA
jgi:iron complex transport system permease protein